MEDRNMERRFVRRVAAWSAVAAALIVAAVLLLRAYAPQLSLLRVSSLISEGRVEEALERLDALADVDADEANSLRYRAALALDRQGKTDEAMALYDSLVDFANAGSRSLEIRYTRAQAQEASGDLENAAQAYYLLGTYADAADRYQQCMAILHPTAAPTATPAPTSAPTAQTNASGDATPALTDTTTVALTTPPTPAPTTEAEWLAAARAAVPQGRLALGQRHTVGLKADGTVTACGDNSFGQCDVAAWRDVAQVAAGAGHTVALLADGTVVACGDNQSGQCDVTKWRNVAQVAANDYATFGLLAGGTLVHTGYLPYEEVAAWHDVRAISAGAYGLMAVYGGGTLASHPSMALDAFVCAADCSRGYAVGLREDGTVTASGVSLPDWRRIVALSAGENAVLALDANGAVRAFFFRVSDAISPDMPDQRVVAVAAGSTHYALLLADGGVLCFGENADGQCDTQGWKLF